MQREIIYEWSPELVRVGVRRFISRYAGRSLIGVLIVLAVGIAGLVAGGGGYWWFITVGAVIYILIWGRYYFRVIKAAEEIAGEITDHRITLRIEPETVTFQTSEQTTIMKWSAIKKLWCFPDVLLVFTYNRWNYSMIPVAPLGEEMKRFIEDKVRERGGKVG